MRNANNMTQEQLAESLDISIKHCSCVERGVAMLSLEKLLLCSELFHVSLDYLLAGKDTLFIPEAVLSFYKEGGTIEKELLEDYIEIYAKMSAITKNKEF